VNAVEAGVPAGSFETDIRDTLEATGGFVRHHYVKGHVQTGRGRARPIEELL
jgi:hypothetical protein